MAYGRKGLIGATESQIKKDYKQQKSKWTKEKREKHKIAKQAFRQKMSYRKSRWDADDNFYVVFKGYKPSIYTSFEDAKRNVAGYYQPIYRGFDTLEQAQDWFMSQHGRVKKCHGEMPMGAEQFYKDIKHMRKLFKKSEANTDVE